jgi:broad specificity phosphatase PhoE
MLTKKSFYFVRHGETDHNRQGLCAGGKVDTSLNETGKQQALLLGETILLRQKLNNLSFGRVVSSPMKRAMETARLALNVEPQIEHDLREWELGELEEKPVAQFLEYIAQLPRETPLRGGESWAFFCQRIATAMNRVLEVSERPLIVAHGGVHWALLKMLELPTRRIENTELVYFCYDQGGWRIERDEPLDPQ